LGMNNRSTGNTTAKPHTPPAARRARNSTGGGLPPPPRPAPPLAEPPVELSTGGPLALTEPCPVLLHLGALILGYVASAGGSLGAPRRSSPAFFNAVVRVIGDLQRTPALDQIAERQFPHATVGALIGYRLLHNKLREQLVELRFNHLRCLIG